MRSLKALEAEDGESADAYIITTVKLVVSEVQFLFPENSNESSFLACHVKNLSVCASLLKEKDAGGHQSFRKSFQPRN